MKDRIRAIRDTILSDVWDSHKNEWDIDEIAEAMNINLKTAYRILKNKYEEDLKTNK